MRYINVKDLTPGMIIANNLYDNNELVLLKANTELTQFYIDRIIGLDYDGIYIFDQGDVEKAKSIVSDETRIKVIGKLKKLDIDACMFLANSIVNEIQNSDSLIIERVTLSSYDNYTYVHSVNVDILSVIIGIGLGLRNEELNKLSQAALLHDIGKCDVPVEIINKPARLTPEEYEEVKKHPQYGLERLRAKEKGGDDIAAVIKNAVYSHHENWDGSGYPRGLIGEKIHLFARIIHVADVYDALTTKRAYKNALNPADTLEYLMANTGIMFDKDIVSTFLQYVAPYPIGCTVLLSDGQQGVISENNRINLPRPKVKLSNGTIIDLTEKLDVTIISILM
ncbi:HD-GYP domain-containing protein [Butyrivibrio proteoclasticus B316]|uniref:HD-GYP domain-containing protein n=1 Tax=Butyrivibrio proteoclasticus (strain ATCC 51982 / DSM 14932 / B316) TaxID=515622 RepID=E0RY62_BUTPB|nr:HD-GYP domain-containing protein [Butyrivibrio proteoclasticus]ADL35017.1 HD-GYP domain-containing protein [Butyrivibrio proteoclasticus B316]